MSQKLLIGLVAGALLAPSISYGASKSDNIEDAYKSAVKSMEQDMPRDLSGNPDKDFVRLMIPHHKGAIEMARIEAEHGKDPDLRKLAKKMIDDQEEEISKM